MPRRVCPSPAAPLPRSRILGGIRCVTFVQAKGIHFSVVSSVRLRRCTVGGMTTDLLLKQTRQQDSFITVDI